MLSRQSYIRLFAMAVLLTGSYAGLRAEEEMGPLDCYGDHAIQCQGGQVRDSPAQMQACNNACSACGYGSASFAYAYTGGPANGPGCDGNNNHILYCYCGNLME